MNTFTNPRFDHTNPDVIARLQLGDEQEFENLLKFIIRPLCYFVLNRIRGIGTYEDAEDITSEALCTVYYEVKRSYDPQKGRLPTWIYRIAENRAINFIRKQIKLKERDRMLAEQEPKEDKRRKSSKNSLYNSQIQARAYDALSEIDKEILRLSDIFDDKVISEMLKISVDAVHQRRSRATSRWLAACEKIKNAE